MVTAFKSSTLRYAFFTVIFVLIGSTTPHRGNEDLPETDQLSNCTKKCLEPIYKMKRTFHYVFANFEKVCDILDTAADCSQKCERSEQTKFWQFTTFYRVHCVNHEEEIEQHLKCLSNAAVDVDSVCKEKCQRVSKVEPGMNKDEKVNRACKAVECSTICYFHEFAQDCPKAKDLLVRINLDQINEVSLSIHPKQHEAMSHECRHIHNLDYMKAAMLSSFDEFDE